LRAGSGQSTELSDGFPSARHGSRRVDSIGGVASPSLIDTMLDRMRAIAWFGVESDDGRAAIASCWLP
jgi:hypothetical protein